eukprot:663324-Pleurochrysis_carterae.AAC.1
MWACLNSPITPREAQSNKRLKRIKREARNPLAGTLHSRQSQPNVRVDYVSGGATLGKNYRVSELRAAWGRYLRKSVQLPP